MAINPPVDATQTPEWAALQKHYDELQVEGVSLKKWFAEDAERVEKLSFDAGDLHFDLSKNLIKPETLQLFANLAKPSSSMSAPRLCTPACTSTTPRPRRAAHRAAPPRSKTRASTSLTVRTPSRTCARHSTRSTLSLTTCVPASGPV